MAGRKSDAREGRVGFNVSTAERPEFTAPLVAYVFDAEGKLVEQADVKGGRVDLAIGESQLARARVFIAPRLERQKETTITAASLERAGAYEPVLRPGGKLVDTVFVPGTIIDWWPFCFCWVRGQVVRASDNRPVCGARVHVCEVDPIPIWILRLPDRDLFRLRDDLLEVLRTPPIPEPQPGPDPAPFERAAFRFKQSAAATKLQRAALNPQPLPPKALSSVQGAVSHGGHASISAQPLPPRGTGALRHPGEHAGFDPQPEPPSLAHAAAHRVSALTLNLQASLASSSATIVRQALVANWQILVPYLCLWPWWWWWFRCDEVAVVTTDAHGRFETAVVYPCGGDHPDLYFWVEFDFGSGFETVYHPPIPCNTYWNYACGTEVTIRVHDARVPACGGPGDLPGCQVVVLSIGNGVAVREVQTDAAGPAFEGLTTAGQPFGGTLEPRFDCSRTELIENRNIPFYRWSVRRLSGPDGVTTTVDPSSPQIGVWTVLTRDVFRHYELGTSYPSVLMGPLASPTDAPIPNLFAIQPANPPAGPGWDVLNEHVDLATAYFETASLLGAPTSGPTATGPAPDDLAAGRYELKLELFDDTGALVNWTQRGVDLRITDQDAPFGTGTITTSPAPAYNRILNGAGETLGFRMVVRVDNNRCYAEILPVAGDVTPDPACGFHEYSDPTDDVRLSFIARHPNGFANYAFATNKAADPPIAAASTSGVSGATGNNGFTHVGGFTYQGDVSVATLIGSCSNAAFGEHLSVNPTATDGYSTLNGYRHTDTAAFALAVPCPPCACEEEEEEVVR